MLSWLLEYWRPPFSSVLLVQKVQHDSCPTDFLKLIIYISIISKIKFQNKMKKIKINNFTNFQGKQILKTESEEKITVIL